MKEKLEIARDAIFKCYYPLVVLLRCMFQSVRFKILVSFMMIVEVLCIKDVEAVSNLQYCKSPMVNSISSERLQIADEVLMLYHPQFLSGLGEQKKKKASVGSKGPYLMLQL